SAGFLGHREIPLLVTGIFLYRSYRVRVKGQSKKRQRKLSQKGVGSNLGSNFRPANFTGSKFEPKLR
ncbi:MAG: hypothetical protein KAI25_03485, partial [Hyphomicrobiaceae bacterium]|nr:hypothetical protein [Hyphomicrobiaceae bacterium]